MMYWLVSEDDAVDAGAEQHDAAQVYKDATQENNIHARRVQTAYNYTHKLNYELSTKGLSEIIWGFSFFFFAYLNYK